MYLNLLHLDDALKQQPLFMETCANLQARETEAIQAASMVRLWGKSASIDNLRKQLTSSIFRNCGSGTVVTFMGSGDFHHVSALLIGMLAEANREPLTVIHFDNHPDWVHFKGGMHCGSWVNRALDLPQVEKVITIGVCSHDLKWPQFKHANLKAWRDGKIILFPWHSPSERFRQHDIEAVGEDDFLESLASLITTRNVYITIDKDVLSHRDAITNWDQGKMPLARLLGIVGSVLERHHAIGIDVTGDYSAPHYAGRMHHVALKKLESMLDQPKQPIVLENAANVNQMSNMALLSRIREAI